MPKLVIGLRAYLVREKDKELDLQIREARKYFPDADIVVTICGNKYNSFTRRKANNIIYYSEKPLGLGKTWEIIVDYAKKKNADELIVVDGDDQHFFSEIRKVYEQYRSQLIIPQREKRFIFSGDSELHGITLEDLENAFIRFKHKTRINDLQSGLFIIKDKRIINGLDFLNKNSFIGDFLFLDQILDKKIDIELPVIRIRPQTSTISSRSLVFSGIQAYENHFGIRFQEIIKISMRDPSFYLPNGKLSVLTKIEELYLEYINSEKVKDMKGLILAGGHGTRLRPITYTVQKQLIPIANKPIIYYVIEDLVNSGIKDIGIVIGPNKNQFMRVVGDGSRWNAKITYIDQDNPKGLAHAVLISKEFLDGKDFVMYLGDNLLKENIHEFVKKFNNSNVDASILLTPVSDPEKFGIAKLDNNGNVTKLLEKPKNPPTNLAIVGVYAFRNSIFKAISNIKSSKRGELEITDAMQWLLDNKYKISSTLIKDYWKDTGNAEALLDANRMILDSRLNGSTNLGKISIKSTVKGRVRIGKNTIIYDNSIISGPVVIGDNCKIGPNAYIGPYTSIGNGVIIKETELENSIVLNNSFINSGKRIVDSVMGENSKVSSAKNNLPEGHKLIISDNSQVGL